jgi:hypothetical protein
VDEGSLGWEGLEERLDVHKTIIIAHAELNTVTMDI